jgi:hypothetical protein
MPMGRNNLKKGQTAEEKMRLLDQIGYGLSPIGVSIGL